MLNFRQFHVFSNNILYVLDRFDGSYTSVEGTTTGIGGELHQRTQNKRVYLQWDFTYSFTSPILLVRR